MKVIDLLNKIANKQKVPKKIKCNDDIYWYDETNLNEVNRYIDIDNGILTDYCNLDDEVEIIEEPQEHKIPEKIIVNDDGTLGFPKGSWTARNIDEAFAIKVNEIIDYLKENK